MMRIGGRVGFAKIENLERTFRSIDFPIELALPWKYQDLWLPIEDKIGQVIDFFKSKDLEILSIHATQGRITDEAFLKWGKLTLDIARSLGVHDVVLHPNSVKNQKSWHQENVLRCIRRLGGSDIFSIETFKGKDRVFLPIRLVEKGIPMTLDTAHIPDQDLVMEIVNGNHRNIRSVHLSSIGKGEHHLPIDDFCIHVVDRLNELNWSGNVILE